MEFNDAYYQILSESDTPYIPGDVITIGDILGVVTIRGTVVRTKRYGNVNVIYFAADDKAYNQEYDYDTQTWYCTIVEQELEE